MFILLPFTAGVKDLAARVFYAVLPLSLVMVYIYSMYGPVVHVPG
jgi:hypothetical protein